MHLKAGRIARLMRSASLPAVSPIRIKPERFAHPLKKIAFFPSF
jgi:hypothetical protein